MGADFGWDELGRVDYCQPVSNILFSARELVLVCNSLERFGSALDTVGQAVVPFDR